VVRGEEQRRAQRAEDIEKKETPLSVIEIVSSI
jgi:hypothetical protein